MYLQKMEVKNFRILKDVIFNFTETESQELTLIVGKNNTGKTSILKILEKMIPGSRGDSFEWYDFSMEYQHKIFNTIINYKYDEDIPQSCGIELILHICYSDEDSYEIIRPFLMDLDEENNTILVKCSYSIKDDGIRSLQTELKNMEITEIQDFILYMQKNYSRYFRFEYSALSECKKNKTEITKENLRKLIRIESIQANRDISNKASDHSLSNISDRLYSVIEDQDREEYEKFQKSIRETDLSLTEAYSEVFKEVLSKLKNFGASSDSEIEILSTIQDKDLLKNNTTLFYNKNKIYLPESYNGLGYLNLIGMIFEIETIASEFEKQNLEAKGLNIIFIEEPEAHTHPQLQYVFIKNIKKLLNEHKEKNIQTLMTTHSSHIVSECDFEDVIYLSRENHRAKAKAFLELKEKYDSSYDSFEFIKKYLKLTRAELFFADKAILIEGDTERILMRSMIDKIDNKLQADKTSKEKALPLASQNISIIEVGSHAHVFKKLVDFLDIKTLIITDIDYGELNENNKIVKCDFKDAKYTTNTTIKKFFINDTGDFDEISKIKNENKVKGKCRIAYQTKESGLEDNYVGRSFEEAFININFEYIDRLKDDFTSMKNKHQFTSERTPYKLAEVCIEKKTSFATDVLFYGNGEWKTPKYIEEGLIWLRED